LFDLTAIEGISEILPIPGFQPHAEEGACRLQEQLVVDWPKEHGRRTSWRRGGSLMEESKLYTARVQVVEAMEQGLSWHEAAKQAWLQISQSTAYRLRQRMRRGGKQALQEGRHGHPAKVRGEVREFLKETCRQTPHTPSHEIQAQLAERFALPISLSQINRVRAA